MGVDVRSEKRPRKKTDVYRFQVGKIKREDIMGEGIIYILYSAGVQGRGRDHGYTQDKDIGG